MKGYVKWMVLLVSGTVAITLGCESASSPPVATSKKSEAVKPAAGEAAEAAAWGTLRGRLVFAGDQLPEPTQLKVEKDTEHCLSKGPLMSEKWVVDPKTKGVRYAVAFLKQAKGKPLAVHESLKAFAPEVVLDQPTCAFEPHVLAIREGQRILAKNPSPIVHNVMFQGFKNSANVQIPPGQSHIFQPLIESGPIKIACGAHQWMEGYVWVFDHPYFAVTDAEGNFEIKMAPAGTHNFVVWQEAVNYVPDAKGRTVEVKPDGVTDLGDILIKPQ